MKLTSIAVSIILAANVVLAQAADDASKTAAVVNGETISVEKLDALYRNLPMQVRAQYDQAGGKKAFLDNYVAKRLLIQEAMKRGFDQQPEVKQAMEAAKESTLFDRYVREVVASNVVPDSAVREFYEANIDDFSEGEQIKVRHIVIGTERRAAPEAEALAKKVAAELEAYRSESPAVFQNRFADFAQRYSEDASAKEGGDLGWSGRGRFDKKFEEAAFALKAGEMSAVVPTRFGYHLILVDEVKPAGPRPFESVRRDIREFLLSQKSSEIMTAVTRLTNELRRQSRVAIYEENVD